MPDINDAWAEKQRLRWMRPDAHKFLPPGSLSPEPAPFDRTAWKRRCEAEADALEARLIARERKRLLALKSELLDLKRELPWRRLRRQLYAISEMDHAFTSAARQMLEGEETYPDDVLMEILLVQDHRPALKPMVQYVAMQAIEISKQRNARTKTS